MLPAVGEVVAEKYTIERLLGQGGMAVVFAAHHTILDRPVAMKILSPELPRTPVLVERFLTEARAAARVDSAHVARVFDAGTLEDGLPFIVMERLEGCDLGELLTKYKRLPVGDAVDYVLQALQGLAHAHVLGVIHRDLKPANLFLAEQADATSIIKVLDFGIAKLVDEARLIARGQTMGSPMYMSPEQVRDAEHVDPRADIWSIGVVLYELLTGRTPFESDNVTDTFVAVLQGTPQPARTLRPDIPAELDAAVMRCLDQRPEGRFADVAELALALAAFGTGACEGVAEAVDQTLRQSLHRGTPAAGLFSSPVSVREHPAVRIAFADDTSLALYGDATPASLDTSFFGFLGDALDVFAEVLVRDDEIERGRGDRERLPREAAAETERLRGVAAAAKEAIAHAPTGGPASPSARVGAATVSGLESAVTAEVAKLEAGLAKGLAAIAFSERAAREACTKTFEAFLLRHDLPGAASWLELKLAEGGGYAAQVRGDVEYGLRWSIELEIPAKHALGRVARLEKLARIEVDAPELTGWIRKEIKLRPQRLDRYYLTELTLGDSSFAMKLRAAPDGEGDGFDVDVDLSASKFELSRPNASDAPYAVEGEGAAKLARLQSTLREVARDLAASRKRVVEATLDGEPLWRGHDPRIVVERVVGVIAPLVREVGLRSPSATELALKRSSADNRREEIFVSKAELRAKLDRVPERERAVIGPLVLALEGTGVRGSQPSYPRIA